MNEEEMVRKIEEKLVLIAKGKIKFNKHIRDKFVGYEYEDDDECIRYELPNFRYIYLFRSLKDLYNDVDVFGKEYNDVGGWRIYRSLPKSFNYYFRVRYIFAEQDLKRLYVVIGK